MNQKCDGKWRVNEDWYSGSIYFLVVAGKYSHPRFWLRSVDRFHSVAMAITVIGFFNRQVCMALSFENMSMDSDPGNKLLGAFTESE